MVCDCSAPTGGGGRGEEGRKPLFQEVLALTQYVIGLDWSRSMWTSRDHVSSSRKDREKKSRQAVPKGKETSRDGMREKPFVENLLCIRGFQSELQFCKAGIIILLSKLRLSKFSRIP